MVNLDISCPALNIDLYPVVEAVIDPRGADNDVRAGPEGEGQRRIAVVDGNGEEVLLRAGQVSVPDNETFRGFRVQDHFDENDSGCFEKADVAVKLWNKPIT